MFRTQYDGCRACTVQIPAIACVREKADRPFAGMLKRACRVYAKLGITTQFGAQLPGQDRKGNPPA